MRFGYWLPVFGGWLRNVDDEGMAPTWDYVRALARRSEEWGYDLTLIAELNLNDIKGVRAPSLDAWSTAASLAAVTSTLELMVAVRPTFHEPALLAKQAANIDHISGGRLSLNVVSSWWAEEARQYGVQFDQHDERYARTREWLTVVDGLWSQPEFSFKGRFYDINSAVMEPKPLTRPRPTLYAGGESDTARTLIANQCDAYVMHGDSPAIIARRIEDMQRRREQTGQRPMTFGVAAYAIVRDSEEEAARERERITDVKQSAAGYDNYQQWVQNTQLEQRVSLEDYSVSNRGLRSGLVGTPEAVIAQVQAFEDAGVDLLLLQCSPQLEEMERFARQVIGPYRRGCSTEVLHEGATRGCYTEVLHEGADTEVLHEGAARRCCTEVLHEGAARRCCTRVLHEGAHERAADRRCGARRVAGAARLCRLLITTRRDLARGSSAEKP